MICGKQSITTSYADNPRIRITAHRQEVCAVASAPVEQNGYRLYVRSAGIPERYRPSRGLAVVYLPVTSIVHAGKRRVVRLTLETGQDVSVTPEAAVAVLRGDPDNPIVERVCVEDLTLKSHVFAAPPLQRQIVPRRVIEIKRAEPAEVYRVRTAAYGARHNVVASGIVVILGKEGAIGGEPDQHVCNVDGDETGRRARGVHARSRDA